MGPVNGLEQALPLGQAQQQGLLRRQAQLAQQAGRQHHIEPAAHPGGQRLGQLAGHRRQLSLIRELVTPAVQAFDGPRKVQAGVGDDAPAHRFGQPRQRPLQRRPVEVHQVHLAELAAQPGQVQIVAVPGAEHAQALAPLDGAQQPPQPLAVRLVEVPALPGPVDRRLPLLGPRHGPGAVPVLGGQVGRQTARPAGGEYQPPRIAQLTPPTRAGAAAAGARPDRATEGAIRVAHYDGFVRARVFICRQLPDACQDP